ncbi:MAG: TlpA family protein disulfide reductase [Acidobacteria bacterium]|nr:TlpA family protein disulfide reductase [Acidobacteriota bacterium]
MYKSYLSHFLRLSLLILLIISLSGCKISVNEGSPPPPSDEDVKKAGASLPPPPFPSSITGEALADYGWSATDLTGKTIQASEWKGKVVILNMWATWCGPCVAEMPSLQQLYDKTKADNIVFALVSNEDQETVNKFVQKRKYSLPIYTISENLPSAFSTEVIPKTFVISPTGKIVFEHIGGANWNDQTTIDFLKSVAQLK